MTNFVMNTEFPVQIAEMRSVPGEKQKIERGDLIGVGGYSMVFEGKVLSGGVEARAAVKVIKIRREISEQSDRLSSGSDYSSTKENNSVQGKYYVKKPYVPGSVPRARIDREINYLRKFQENKFILKLLGDVKRPNEIWVISERCEVTIEECFYCMKVWNKKSDPTEALIHIFAPILNAVLFLHSKGYVHLDIKPDNIMVNGEGTPKLIDFGLCLKLDGNSLALSENQAKGSEFFMPPEVAGEAVVTCKSDAFSFGLALLQVYWRIWPEMFFGYVWEGVVYVYKHKEDVEGLEKLQTFLNQNVLEPKCRTSTKQWDLLSEDILNIMCIEVEARGTLNDLAENDRFKSAMEDWNKYPCDDSELSKDFLRQRGYMAFGFREEPDVTVQIAPALQRHEVYATAD